MINCCRKPRSATAANKSWILSRGRPRLSAVFRRVGREVNGSPCLNTVSLRAGAWGWPGSILVGVASQRAPDWAGREHSSPGAGAGAANRPIRLILSPESGSPVRSKSHGWPGWGKPVEHRPESRRNHAHFWEPSTVRFLEWLVAVEQGMPAKRGMNHGKGKTWTVEEAI